MDLDGQRKEDFFPVADFWEMKNKAVELYERDLETEGNLLKKQNYDWDIIDESL